MQTPRKLITKPGFGRTTELQLPSVCLVRKFCAPIPLAIMLWCVLSITSVSRAGSLSDVQAKAEQGDANAKGVVSVLLQIDAIPAGDGESKAQKALKLAEESADAESPFGLYALGRIHGEGVGMQKNADRAKQLYTRAFPGLLRLSEGGDPNAQWLLGVCFIVGRGVEKDQAKAVELFRKSAEQGNADAQRDLAWRYMSGEGVQKDQVKAVEWFRKSAEQGHADAQRDLAWRYDQGEGVEKNPAEAASWFRKSAEQGNARAQLSLGYRYAKGKGVTKNFSEAVKWYLKSAEQGNRQAMRNLAYMEDSTLDASEKNLWLYRAAESDEELHDGPETKDVMALTVGGQLRDANQPPKGLFTVIKEGLSGEFKTRRLRGIFRAEPRENSGRKVYPVRLVFEGPDGGEERWDLIFFKDEFGQWSAETAKHDASS